jgi:hypothetical protein
MGVELAITADLGPRRETRVDAALKAGLRRQGEGRRATRVLNLSRHGFKAEIDERLEPEAIVWLKLPDQEPQIARVVWSDHATAGCAFLDPLPVPVFREVLRANALDQAFLDESLIV